MSSKLKRMLENRTTGNRLITPKIDAWLLANDGIFLSPELATRMIGLMTKRPGTRSGVLHPSSEHVCMRRQMFGYLGVEGKAHHFDSALQNKFNNGTWIHMRWQAMLMEAGILDDIEVTVELPELRLRGSMDGVGTDDRGNEFGFELKGWSAVPDAPLDYHVRQIQTYMFASGLETFSVVYEHKSSQDWTEFIVKRDDEVVELIEDRLWTLNEAIDAKTLIEPLKECRREAGETFMQCPYRNICLDAENDTLDWEGVLK